MEKILSGLKIQIDDHLKTGSQIVIAIDGNCTAGKTTLAALYNATFTMENYNAALVQHDMAQS